MILTTQLEEILEAAQIIKIAVVPERTSLAWMDHIPQTGSML